MQTQFYLISKHKSSDYNSMNKSSHQIPDVPFIAKTKNASYLKKTSYTDNTSTMWVKLAT